MMWLLLFARPAQVSLARRCGCVRYRQAVSLSASAAREVISATGAVAQMCARVGPRRPLARADTVARGEEGRSPQRMLECAICSTI